MFAKVINGGQTIQTCDWKSKKILEEVTLPATDLGCRIEEIGFSPSGKWLVTLRNSGQGEWGYDVLRTHPLERIAGIPEEPGTILELPQFSDDESILVGGAGEGFLGGWWAHPDQDIEEPARGGLMSLGFIFIHHLSNHRITRHALKVKIPKGWFPEDPEAEWCGPRDIHPTAAGIRFLTSWGVTVDTDFPLPKVIKMQTPHPSGQGVM